MIVCPRESAKFISSLSKRVKIIKRRVEELGEIVVDEINSGRLSPHNFSQTDVHPKAEDHQWALDWLLIVDTLNFCFWHNEGEQGWEVEGYTGYFALCAAINRAQKEKVDILNPEYYSRISEEKLRKLLRSDTKVECPLISEKVNCLREVGTVLLQKFEGSFEQMVKKADNSAQELLKLIVENFTCFRDEGIYNTRKVAFYKRAQILIGDIWSCFGNKGIGYFKDIDVITAFADYRIPQTLLWYGVFEYTEDLLKKLNDDTLLKNGEEDEIEIRGCSIHAVELLKEYAVNKLDKGKVNSILVDHFLWDYRRKHAKDILNARLPFHKTFSIYY